MQAQNQAVIEKPKAKLTKGGTLRWASIEAQHRIKFETSEEKVAQAASKVNNDAVETQEASPVELSKRLTTTRAVFIESERAAGRGSKDLEIYTRICGVIEESLGES